MATKLGRLSLSVYLIVSTTVVFAITSVVLVFSVRTALREQALEEAESKAKIILDRVVATHDYFSNNLKPALFALTDGHRPPGYFDPTWMSSTYANRQIAHYFAVRNKAPYYLKECAVNARTPENEANPYERDFIEKLNRDPNW